MVATLALTIAVFAMGVDGYIVAAVLPAIADDLGESVAAVGLMASAYALPTAIAAPLFGPFSDRHGRRAAMLIGLAVFVVAAAACIVAPTLPLLLVARAINGLGAAIALPAVFAYAGDLPTPAERARAMSTALSAYPASTLVGLPIGAAVATAFGWRGTFVFIVAVAILGAILLARLPADPPRTSSGIGYLASYREVAGDRRVLAAIAVTFLWFSAAIGLFVYMAEFVHRSFGVPAAQAGLAYMVVGVVGVAGSRLSPAIVGRLGQRGTVLFGISAFSLAAVSLPLSTAFAPATAVLFTIWAFGTWAGLPAQQTLVAGLNDRIRGTVLAFNSSALNLGGVVGPIVTGQVLAAGGFEAAMPWSALLGLGAFVLAWRVLPRPSVVDAPTVVA